MGSHWAQVLADDSDLGYDSSRNLVILILRQMFKWFDTIVLFEGNHDRRVAQATKGHVYLGALLGGIQERYGERFKYSRYAYLWLHTSRGWVKIVHQQNYSADPVALGQALYDVEPRKCHWVLTHCHRKQRGWSKDGLYEVCAIGTGRDEAKTKYKALNANKFRQWDMSFLMIKGGYFYDMDLKATNWKEALGDLYEKYAKSSFLGEWYQAFRRRLGVMADGNDTRCLNFSQLYRER